MSEPAILLPSLVVAEIFGPTVQGEGPNTGRRTMFLRLGGCNLTCTWCDTPYTWDASRFNLREQMRRMTTNEILNRLEKPDGDCQRVVITGGEPLLQQDQKGWRVLTNELYLAGWKIEVETNGTISPTAQTEVAVSHFNVSPKLAHSGVGRERRLVPGPLQDFANMANADFKFVCTTVEDVDAVASIVSAYHIPAHRVWIMPEGTTAATVLENLRVIADTAITWGFNVTTRLHTLIWGNERKH